jgi:Na+/melibiose symporter-like transporter
MRTYFWGLASEDLRWFALSAIGAIAVLVLIPPLQKRFDKKNLLVGALFLLLFDGMFLVCMRFVDVLPDNGDPRLLWLLVGNGILRGALLGILLVMFVSMLADLLDKQELDTGRRQEGIFMSSISFSAKATSGFGLLLAGVLLEYVIRFPQGSAGVSPADLDAQTVFRLGLMDGIVVPLFYIIPFTFLARGYDLTRQDHEEVQRKLTLVRVNRGAAQSGGAS